MLGDKLCRQSVSISSRTADTAHGQQHDRGTEKLYRGTAA